MVRNKAEQFEFLRFLAFILIFIWHASIWSFGFLPNDRGAVAGVSFFFILSGFLSGYSSYERDFTFSVKETLNYVWKKLKRFYPLYFVTGFMFLMFTDIPANITAHNIAACSKTLVRFLKYLLLIQSWFNNGEYFAFNRAGWFLSSILLSYIFTIPAKVLATSIKKKKNSHSVYGIVFLAIILCTVCYCYLTRDLFAEYYQYIFPVSRLGEYFAGMALGYFIYPLCVKLQSSQKNHSVLLSFAELCSLILFVGAMYCSIPYWCYRIVWWLLPICLVLVVFAFGGGIVSSLFRKNLFVRLGELSMPCFLLNTIVIQIYMVSVGDIVLASSRGKAFSLVFTLIVTILLSALVNKKSS